VAHDGKIIWLGKLLLEIVKTFAAQKLQRFAQAVVQHRLKSVGWVFPFLTLYLINITMFFVFIPLNSFLGTILE